MIDYRKFISHVKPGKLKKNKYQFEEFQEAYNHRQFQLYIFNCLYYSGIIHRVGINHKEGTPITEVKENPIQWVQGFLDFHYSEYKGLKDDFLLFLEDVRAHSRRWAEEFKARDKPTIDRFIDRWVAAKERELGMASLNKASSNKTKATTSYKWETTPEQDLPELYDLMKGTFIHNDTTFLAFKNVFSNKPIVEIVPIKWHDDNASEVLFFIKRLEETSNIEPIRYKRWGRLKACFIKPDSTPFREAFKNLNQNILINLSQSKQEAINKLIENF